MESEDKKPIFTKRLILIILAVILLILIIFLLLRKCGGGSNYLVQSITLSPTSVGIDKGQNYPIYAYVLPEDAKDKSIIWSSSDENVATVDAAGLVTGINEGTATITATAGDGSGVTGQCIVTVGSALPTLEQIQLNKSTYSVKVGKSVLVEVTPIPSTAQLTDIQYSIADTSIATVDMYGTIKGVKVGTTTLTVTANNGGVTATATVKVTKSSGGSGGTSQTPTNPTDVAVTGINLPTDGCYKLRAGNEYTLTASIVPPNATNQELKWESSDTSIATVTATGKVIASNKTGTVTIKATAKSGVFNTYEIRVVSKSSKEGSCSSGNTGGNPGGNTGGNPGGNTGGNQVTTPNVGEINGDGVLTEATTSPVYNNKPYNLTISGYIQSSSINKGVDGWMQDASCTISLNGILPPYYKATYETTSGSVTEFRTRAHISSITGPVKVKVTIYDRLLTSDNELNPIDIKTVTVCNKINNHQIRIDNTAPTCSLHYSGANSILTLSASDEGGSSLHKVVWENGETSSFRDNVVSRDIASQYQAGTRKFVATVYDKAGNAGSCGMEVADLESEGTDVSVNATDPESITTLKDLKLSVNKTKLFGGDSLSINVSGIWADGSIRPYNNYSILENNIPDYVVNGGEIPTDLDFGTASQKTITFSVYSTDHPEITSDSVSITIQKEGRVTCTLNVAAPIETSRGYWYKGEPKVTCSAENGVQIKKMGVCFAGIGGECNPPLSSVTANSTVTKSVGKITGQGKICYSYETSNSSGHDCIEGYRNFDNTRPTCSVSIDRAVFMYKIDDDLDSSGLKHLKTSSWGTEDLSGSSITVNHTYDRVNNKKPSSTDYVVDEVGYTGECTGTSFSEDQLRGMENAATEEIGRISITTSAVHGEMWVCSDNTQQLDNCEGNIILNSAATRTFEASIDAPGSDYNYTSSILNILRKYDTNISFEWKSSNPNVIKLSSTTGKRVTGTYKGVGDAVITVCVKGTTKCATEPVSVDSVIIRPKTMYVSHSATMALGVKENLNISVYPNAAKKDVIITSSNPSVISVEDDGVIAARSAGKATLTVKSAYNTSLVKTLEIEVIAKDTTKPTANITTSQIVEGVSGKYMYVYFQGSDTESNIKMNYNLVKGTSCSASKTLDTSTRNAQTAQQITTGGTYTACIEVTDAAGNKTTSSKTINANLPESGAITCSVSGTTSGQIEIGTSKTATVTCTSNEEIKLNHKNINVSGIGARASVSERVTNSGSLHRAVFTVTITAYAGGTSTLTLNAGALSTASKSSPSVKLGTYECVGSDVTTDPSIPTPSISFRCGTETYGTSCTKNVSARVSNMPANAEAIAVCLTSGSSCVPTNTTSTPSISTTGTYKFCARYRVNGKFGPTGCSASKYIVINKDGDSTQTPTYNIGISGPSTLAAGESGTLRPTLSADFTPKTYVWTSSNKTCVIVDKTAENPKVTAAKVTTKCTTTITLDAADARGNHAKATKTITVTPTPVQAPSKPSMGSLVKSNGSSYTLGTWSNQNLKATITSASGTTLKICHTSSGSSCTPSLAQSSNSFTFNLTANGSSGNYTYCAVAVKDGIESSVACKTYTNYKIDKNAPTCSGKVSGGLSAAITFTVSESGSGVSSWESGYTNTAAGKYYKSGIKTTGTYTFTVKDAAGNQGSCSVTVSSKTQYNLYSCGSYGYGTPTTSTVDSCTSSGTKGTSYNYTTCTTNTTTTYGYNNNSVSGACTDNSNEGLLVPVKATLAKKYLKKQLAIDACKLALSKKCSAGQSLASNNCTSGVKEYTETTYTKSVYQANACNSWKAGSWLDSRPPQTGCNSIICNLKTRTWFY